MIQDRISYKEIETRILNDRLKKGVDIHKLKASEIFKVSQEDVTDDMRRVAKIINYYNLY